MKNVLLENNPGGVKFLLRSLENETFEKLVNLKEGLGYFLTNIMF